MQMKKLMFIVTFFFMVSFTWSQATSRIPLIGENAPPFTAQTTNGNINFPTDFGTKWKILFSHPGDFTPVCTSEILELALMQQDFKDLGVEIAVISTDNLTLHTSWVNSMNDIKFNGENAIKINFPLMADDSLKITNKYGMISPDVDVKRTVRGVFIIDPENKIEAIFFYPKNIGRNMDEIKRTVIALQTSREHNVLTPVNWKPGDNVLLPFPYPFSYDSNNKDQNEKDGYKKLTWYMLFKDLNK